MINKPKNKVFKEFTNHRKKTKRTVVFSCNIFPTFYQGPQMRFPTI